MEQGINYYWICAAVLLLGAAAFGVFPRLSVRAPASPARWMWILAGGMALAYCVLGLYKIQAQQMGLWDFGIYDSMLRMAARGEGLMRDYRGGAYDHFSPAILLLVPLYWLWDSPAHLVVTQALGLAAGVPLTYFLARRYFRAGSFPLLLAAMYALNPYCTRLALYDFHSESFFPALFLGAFLLRARGHWLGFTLLLLASPLLKEDFVVPLGGVGLFFLFTPRRRRLGALFLAAAAGWALFVLFVYFPHIVKMDYWHFDRYGVESSGVSAWMQAFAAMFGRLFVPTVPAVLLSVLLPFAFLPAFSWRMFLFILGPTLGVHLVATFWHQNVLLSHYASALIGVLPVAALWGARSLRAVCRQKARWRKLAPRAACAAFVLVSVGHLALAEWPLMRFYTPLTGWKHTQHFTVFGIPLRPLYWEVLGEAWGHAEKFRIVAETYIPLGASVTAQNELGTHFLRRNKVYSIRQKVETDYMIFDAENYRGFEMAEELQQAVHHLRRRSRNYRTLYEKDGIIIFAKK